MARNIFVTGATSGIGLCIAEAYAKHGDNVLISGRRAELLGEVQARLSNGAVYCATKAAVKTLSDGIRMDTIATDIKVTTIQPGIVETPFSEVRFHGDAERAKSVYAGIDAIQPEDVADVVLYVTNQPKRLQISDVTIMANQQAAGFMVHKK